MVSRLATATLNVDGPIRPTKLRIAEETIAFSATLAKRLHPQTIGFDTTPTHAVSASPIRCGAAYRRITAPEN
jgi:hypothetical protein